MREKLKTVKNTVVHVLILLLVFIGAVVLFEADQSVNAEQRTGHGKLHVSTCIYAE